jgi:hypothetical protein
MSLPDLATTADLSARGVEPDDDDIAEVFLAVASSVVRAAAQSPVVETTSTVTLWGLDGDRYLDLPGKPVTDVSAVSVDGAALTDGAYKLIQGRLWRLCGWGHASCPAEVVVTMTHGYLTAPEWVVQIVCDLAIAGIKAAPNGARDPRIFVESLGPYSVTYSQAGALVATAMELPTATRQALRKAFGGGAALVAAR